MKQIREFLANLTVIVIISFTVCLVVYLLLLPEDKKPTTYKEITIEHFLR
jgi:hypothetical protein